MELAECVEIVFESRQSLESEKFRELIELSSSIKKSVRKIDLRFELFVASRYFTKIFISLLKA